MIEKGKQNRYWAWGGGAAIIVVAAIILWLSGAFEPSGLRLTEESDLGFLLASVHARLWHAHWHFHHSYPLRPAAP